MAESGSSSDSLGNDARITLGLLNAVQDNHELTQRSVSKEMGIALGLVNAYLKRCVRKGYVKVRQIPRNRYAYYLTPKGFTEKSRLTAEYFSQSFKFFRLARIECDQLFELCAKRKWKRVVLAGASDLGEIATLCARDFPVTLVGFVDARSKEGTFAGLPVKADIGALGRIDAVIVTDLREPQAAFDDAAARLTGERVLVPPFLRVERPKPDAGE